MAASDQQTTELDLSAPSRTDPWSRATLGVSLLLFSWGANPNPIILVMDSVLIRVHHHFVSPPPGHKTPTGALTHFVRRHGDGNQYEHNDIPEETVVLPACERISPGYK